VSRALHKEIPNHKFQIPNKSQIPISKIQNKFWSLEFWSLEFVWYLVLGAWDFLAQSAAW